MTVGCALSLLLSICLSLSHSHCNLSIRTGSKSQSIDNKLILFARRLQFVIECLSGLILSIIFRYRFESVLMEFDIVGWHKAYVE